jgi:hypothetical protein
VVGEGYTNDADNSGLQSRIRAAYHEGNMILPDWTAYLIIFWSVFLFVWNIVLILYLNPKRTRNLISQIWNDKIELTDLNGDVIKVPITKIVKDKEGNELEQTEMVVAPLWYTILYGAGSMAATQVKMSLLSAKGKISRDLNKAALMGDADFNPAVLAGIEMLPKKYQGIALMLSKYLGRGGTTEGGAGQSSKPGNKGAI